MNLARAELRNTSAAYLNSLGSEELFNRFGITRIGDVTGLDRIGVPVFTACRPVGKIISIHAGKALDRSRARAGAIAEGIEVNVFESPGSHSRGPVPDLGFPLAANSEWTPETPVAFEAMTHLATAKEVPFPSSLIWLTRPEGEGVHFQKSSNGQATGGSFADALLQGLYECVERDQYILRRCSVLNLGVCPPRVTFSHPGIEAIERAGFQWFLFLCSADIQIPVYWMVILDPAWRPVAGWGAHINPRIAAERAVLEAIQSRAVIISGARDDLDRRDPDWIWSFSAAKNLSALPIEDEVRDWAVDLSAEEELLLVLDRLGSYWRERIYYKYIDLNPIHVVKVQVLGFEQLVARHWKEIRWSKLLEAHTRGVNLESLSALW